MDNNLEREKKKKIVLITSIITLIILAMASSTIAYFGWFGEESSISVTVSGEGSCSVKTDNNIFIEPTATKEEGRIIKFTAEQGLAASAYISWNMMINEINGLNDATFMYEMINTTTGKSYGSGNFRNIADGSIITFSNETEKLSLNTEYEFTLYLWMDGTIGNNPLSMAGQELDFDMNCTISDEFGFLSGEKTILKNFIKKQYTSGNQEIITQKVSNDRYYYSYQDAGKTWGLMNDGLKVDNTLDATTTGLATTVTDTTALTSGTEGNIRYFGPSDKVNNYIYFNCETYPDTNCELWRIIGIVDGKVKIIKEDSIGNLAWDQDKNQNSSLITSSNNWKTSSLQEFLNGLYYNRGDKTEHTYYSGSDGNTTKILDLEAIGITSATRNNNLISESTWYLGGYLYSSGLYPNDIYNYERTNIVGTTIYSGNPFTVNANIGLMYPSDFGYGTNLTKCSDNIYKYDTRTDSYACVANNWLFNSRSQWLITSDLLSSDGGWIVSEYGFVNCGYVVYYTERSVRPVLYLNSELAIGSEGDGTSVNPYRIRVS